MEGVFRAFGYRDPKDPHGIQGDVDIGAALHRRQDLQDAWAVQQGKGKEQPGDELTADIAAQRVSARRESAADSQALTAFLQGDIFLRKEGFIDADTPLHQTAGAGKDGPGALDQSKREEKTERASALPAWKAGVLFQRLRSAPDGESIAV